MDRQWAQQPGDGGRYRTSSGSHVDAHSPCEGNGELPAFALDGGLDVSRWEIIGEVDVQLDVLEVRRVVYHVENQAARYAYVRYPTENATTRLATHISTKSTQTRMSWRTPAIDSMQLPKGCE